MRRALVALLLLYTAPAAGHTFLPAVIEIHAGTGEEHEVVLRPPRLPPGDERVFEPRVGPPCAQSRLPGSQPRWRLRCPAAALAAATVGLVQVAGAPGLPRPEVLVDRRWPDGGRDLGVAATDGGPRPPAPGPLGYARLGVEHILGGLDHLLFVAGLVALGGGLGALLSTITAFTLGHSVTLAAIALGLLRPGAATVEILIAATLLLLGRELARPRARAGPRLALIFGLVHGAGFAAALADVGLPPSGAVGAIFAFNAGIEVGQLAFVAALLVAGALPLVRRLLERRVAAYALGATAAVLLLERVRP